MKRKLFLISVYLLPALAHGSDLHWKIQKDRFGPDDEQNFSLFVTALGRAAEKHDCKTLDECLKSSANPYRASDSPETTWFADCSKLPYTIRAYFAFKNHLPFGFVSEVTPAPGNTNPDDRYSTTGNLPTARYIVSYREQSFPLITHEIARINNLASSAMYRIGPEIPELNDQTLFNDFYSVAITRTALIAGTIIYDPNGHVALVYDVTADGQILFMDAHPDGSLTTGVYGEKFMRSSPVLGAGFKRFRPAVLTDFETDGDGNLIGGKLSGALNSDIEDFSLVQYWGQDYKNTPDRTQDWRAGVFKIDGVSVGYYRYVRAQMTSGTSREHPLQEVTELTRALCKDTEARIDSVAAAVSHQISSQPHPKRLPQNIFGATGEWESFATPARDARLKVSFRELRSHSQDFVERWKRGDSTLDYAGTDLVQDLIETITDEMDACKISYTKTDGSTRTLTLLALEDRLFSLSFDPYQCAELRWGASDADEISSCNTDQSGRDWYQAEAPLRNLLDRNYEGKMDWTIDELTQFGKSAPELKVPPEISALKYLKSQKLSYSLR